MAALMWAHFTVLPDSLPDRRDRNRWHPKIRLIWTEDGRPLELLLVAPDDLILDTEPAPTDHARDQLARPWVNTPTSEFVAHWVYDQVKPRAPLLTAVVIEETSRAARDSARGPHALYTEGNVSSAGQPVPQGNVGAPHAALAAPTVAACAAVPLVLAEAGPIYRDADEVVIAALVVGCP